MAGFHSNSTLKETYLNRKFEITFKENSFSQLNVKKKKRIFYLHISKAAILERFTFQSLYLESKEHNYELG